jgi:hypothetical protein
VIDALSRRYIILSTLNAKLLSFDYVKDLYAKDSDFANVYNCYEKSTYGKFYRLGFYLFKENKFYVSDSFMLELLMCEAHEGSLVGYFGVRKTLEVLYKYFDWSKIKYDVQKVCDKCITCRQAKSKVLSCEL